MKVVTNMIRLFLLCLLFSVYEAYGQEKCPLKSEPLSNGDTAVWMRGLGEVNVYLQKEHERYVELFHYRDTAKVDDRSIWLMYQSLCKPGIRDVQKKLGNLLVDCMKSTAAPDTIHALTVLFMLDRNGRIIAIGRFSVQDKTLDLPSEIFLDIACRMKKEIKYPSLPGKDYYPWGISINPGHVKIGRYRLPNMSRIWDYPR